MTEPDEALLESQFVAFVGDETDALAFKQRHYLTRETYSRDRVSTLMTSF